MSHLGRPQKKKKEDGSINVEKFTLKHIVSHLSQQLEGVKIMFCPETVGEEAEKMAAALVPGEILVLENTRFNEGEEKGDEDLAEQMAELGDVYVNDAFGTAHRKHASTSSKTILWNGPMGVFEMEPFAKGTKTIAKAVAKATKNGHLLSRFAC